MTKFAFAFLAASLLTGTALAADLQVYAPVDVSEPAATGNFYGSIFGGAALIDDFDFVSSIIPDGVPGVMRFDTGYSVDAALGYDFGNGLSIEAQVGYLNAGLSDGNFGGTDTDAEGTASITYGMLNGWYGFDLGGITPFVGGGVGLASLALDGDFEEFPDSSINDHDETWVAQVGAGVSLAITEDISLTGRYRYMTTGEISLTDDSGVGGAPGDENVGSASISIFDVGLKVAF